MAKEPKHHYIPEFYLQQWAGKDGKLIEYCRRYNGVEARLTAPGGTGYIRGLYRLPDAPPGEEDLVETKVMSVVDNWASRALQQMSTDGLAPGRMEAREALGWSQFLYSLIVRNPEHLVRIRDHLKTLDPGDILEGIREQYPKLRGPADPENFDDYKAAVRLNPIEVPPTRVLPILMRSRNVVHVLTSLKWRTFTLRSAKHSLLTSDRPIIMSNGLAHREAFIMLPIAPRFVFIATKHEDTFNSFRSRHPGELAEAINDQVSKQAYKFVYGSDDRQRRFVSNRLGKRVWSSPLG